MKKLPILKKRAIKIGAPNFRPSYHYSSVVATLELQADFFFLKISHKFAPKFCNMNVSGRCLALEHRPESV